MIQISKMRSKIESYYPSLTKSEKKVADYIFANFKDIMYLSVTELAEHADVGETTIFRFCKKLGFKGYPEFKLMIAQDIVNLEKAEESESTSYKSMIKDNIIAEINECYETLSDDHLNRAIESIYNSNRVFFFGVGSSGITATTAKERFMRIGFPSDVATDAHRMNMVSSVLSENDTIVAFSLSGATTDVLESLAIAKENGVNIIAATSYIKSPITKLSDVILQTSGKANLMEGGSLVNSISQLFIVDLLVTGITLLDKDQTQKMREKTGRSILDKIVK
ncbi:MurR/RpiR family transcriptional regulator [Acidaminobacter sp. JC074]|uniref:MurR/RpiR family transcriptional regulator n=1 Tax=Acidaminobacter sp. JC074 TaxID=2530199 RepID=UPI001F11115F|nr:MurR/RpiR family transcriptional regulator [Acidaminobacter sp. JC074]MCH4887516.1 MurR/RpiR family transcriptional regulator [Acidaminobacter sp. JC074]